ncbi:uncharacterized protein LOC120273204 [Dioscorea cayenensis subsp. rotundata]|uniref:Uncharacterized protein LOC120273204 n=1 Tax=Dioscorea cayennensis subsp. rotundata TaxID=55577 RepID=A0AB40C7E9_DIOCR|nr:uncharacterized protein LOC120273204 [Dioscorea cayenensis subsp. rotundata]
MTGGISSSEPSSSLLHSDPYAIHHSNNPTAVLVQPFLTGDNHASWSRAMTLALRAKSKFGFVDGSLSKSTDAVLINNWGRCNDLVSSWILNSISLEIRPSILYPETASQIWNDLNESFSQSNVPKIYQLKRSISALKQEGMTISLYFTQLKLLWDELSSILPITP